jgi:sulfoxide reductase catalytic subunit YedY
MLIKVPPGWALPEREVTPEAAWRSRREIIKGFGLGTAGALSGGCGLGVSGNPFSSDLPPSPYDSFFPVPRNEEYQVPERPLTDAEAATTYNNFYEFTTSKSGVHLLVGDFEVEPWTVEITGLANNTGTFSVEDLLTRFELEERIYRFRCVEAWAMTVPWSGFPLARLVAFADPTSAATHVRFVSANDPAVMPGADATPTYPWPYTEGLTLAEATNELAMMVAGVYGVGLPRQNGAPLRLIVPWKYGYKNLKSIVRIEFTDYQPATFWNTLVPSEYDFTSNVDPDVPHPRWSQATERLIPDGEEVETMKYNGYGEYVAQLYR